MKISETKIPHSKQTQQRSVTHEWSPLSWAETREKYERSGRGKFCAQAVLSLCKGLFGCSLKILELNFYLQIERKRFSLLQRKWIKMSFVSLMIYIFQNCFWILDFKYLFGLTWVAAWQFISLKIQQIKWKCFTHLRSFREIKMASWNPKKRVK